MVQPLNLVQQMKQVAEQFLGLIPAGSYYDFNNQIYIVTGQVDPTTGKLILQPPNGGQTVLMDPIAQLYPSAVAAPIPTAATQAATSGASGALSALAGPATALAPGLLTKLSNKHVPPSALSTGPGIFDKTLTPDGVSPELNKALMKYAADKSTIEQFLNSGASKDLKLTFDPAAPLGANDSLVQGNLLTAFSDQTAALQKRLDDINKEIANTFPPQPDSSVQPPSITDILNNPLDPAMGIDSPGGFNMIADAQAQPPNMFYTPAQATRLQGLAIEKAQLTDQLAARTQDGKAQNWVDGQMKIYQTALKNAAADVTQVVAQQTFDSINNQMDAQATSLYNNLSPDQQQAYYFNAAKQLRDAKQPFTEDDINALAQKNFAADLHLTQQDQAALTSMVKDTAADNYFLDTGNDFSKASIQDQNAYMQSAYQDLQNTQDYKDFMANKQAAAVKANQARMSAETRSEDIQFGAELAVAAGAGYGEEVAMESLFANGFSFKTFAGVIGAGITMYGALHFANNLLTMQGSNLVHQLEGIELLGMKTFGSHIADALKFLTSLKGFFAIQGLIVFLGWLLGKAPPPEQVAAETLNAELNPVIWNPNGQVIFLTAGLTMATLGINLSPSAPMMQTMTMSQAAATDALTAAGAAQVPIDNSRYADVFVQQGAPGQPTRVVYLTPAGTDKNGKPLETVTVETLNKNFQFAQSQPPAGYIPIFVPGPNGQRMINPVAAANLSNQEHLLLCANGVWVSPAQGCAAAAGTDSHATGSSGGH